MSYFSELKGKIFTKIEGGIGEDCMTFTVSAEESYQLHHTQDCCESVRIEDICGDMFDLIGSPILVAEESTSDKPPEGVQQPEYVESQTWTFYKLRTIKGSVTIRWLGESNGYYSESVYFRRVEE